QHREQHEDRDHDPEARVRALRRRPALAARAAACPFAPVCAVDRVGIERGRILVERGSLARWLGHRASLSDTGPFDGCRNGTCAAETPGIGAAGAVATAAVNLHT